LVTVYIATRRHIPED